MLLKKYKKYFDEFLNKSGKTKITIVVLIGILLLVVSLPTGKKQVTKKGKGMTTVQMEQETGGDDARGAYETFLEEKIKNTLRKVDGVGDVEVTVTLKNTSEKVLATDASYAQNIVNEKDSSGGSRDTTDISSEDTNIYHDTETGSEPFVTKENLPLVEGVVVVAKGGGDATVRTNITEAIMALLSVPAHKIKVMKMS